MFYLPLNLKFLFVIVVENREISQLLIFRRDSHQKNMWLVLN